MSTFLAEQSYQLFSLLHPYTSTLFVVGFVTIAGIAYRDYSAWYALGEGGIPHNILGWSLQCIARLLCSRDVKSTSCYDRYFSDEESFLDAKLLAREGKAPKTGLWAAPHRQLEGTASEVLKKVRIVCKRRQKDYIILHTDYHFLKSVQDILTELATSNSHLLVTGPSTIEGAVPALFIAPTTDSPQHQCFPRSPREVCHIHTTEGSLHALISPTDAKLVIERGWGERHGLSGKLGIPLNFIMIFASRNEMEVEIIERIIWAAARYGLNGKEIS